MAPAGVPMFYAALDEQTALAEARDANPKATALSAGRFELRRPLLVVDLSTTPDVPSLFDEDLGRLRWAFIFLRFFAEAISEPYVRDDRIHIEYVPTQVVTEWFRHRFDAERPEPIIGVMYRSSRHSPGVNVALFMDNSGACDPEEVSESDAALVMTSSTPVVDDE